MRKKHNLYRKVEEVNYSNVSKMGKKGSWFSAIKKVFTHSSKEKLVDGTEKNSSKEKKNKKLGNQKQGDGHSFLPFIREPSSIEKILGEVEREHQVTNYGPTTPPQQPKLIPHSETPPSPLRTIIPHLRTPTLPRERSPLREVSPSREVFQLTQPLRNATRPTPPRVPSPPQVRVPYSRFVQPRRSEPSLREQNACAIKIQTAYRGYMARRNLRALRGLVRLQRVMNGDSVKRQIANALKYMQLFVSVQNQIQSRRIDMLENQLLQRQAMYKNDQDIESNFGKWMSENQEDWDDSTLTKEEREARMKRKFDAIMKRERAMAYAYSHQVWNPTPRMPNGALANFRSGGYPYWWNWLQQRQIPPLTPTNPSQTPSLKNFLPTPLRLPMYFNPTPFPHSTNLEHFFSTEIHNMDTPTPRSTKSRPVKTPQTRFQHKQSKRSTTNSPSIKDNDSLMSCPSYSVPRYMSPTFSASAKLKGVPDSPSSSINEPRKRISFPFTKGGGSFKWNKGKESSTSSVVGKVKNQSTQSVGNLSVDSTVSMPAALGRKPFNRFV